MTGTGSDFQAKDLNETDGDEVDRDDVVQQLRAEQNEYAGQD